MVTAGIIAEYNPFHLGHRHQIHLVREHLGQDTAVVCLMSGNYVQRGEPAVFDKWTRAEEAVRNGANLVLELPITTAVNAGGYFAAGAVDYMNALHGIDYLCFGSECGDVDRLETLAKIISSPGYDSAISEALASGISYASARTAALNHLGAGGQLLETANNSLGVDYIRRIMEIGSTIRPMTVQRDFSLASASTIRENMTGEDWQKDVPNGERLSFLPKHTLKNGERAMLAVLRSLPDSRFEEMPFGSEGLWSKVMKASRKESALEDIILACKSKRYAYSRLRRMLLCLYLGLGQTEMKMKSPYLRVLAFNDRGREVLRKLAETSELPLVSGAVPKTEEAKQYFALEQRATDLYGLFLPEGEIPVTGLEKATPPRIVKKKTF